MKKQYMISAAAVLALLTGCGGAVTPRVDPAAVSETQPSSAVTESPAVSTDAAETTAVTEPAFTPLPGDVLSLTPEPNVIMAGGSHTGCITPEGALYLWGWNGYGQLGIDNRKDANSTPLHVMDGVSSAELGGNSTLIVTTDGSLYYCGMYRSDLEKIEPVKIADGVVKASCDMEHDAYITADGSLYTWDHTILDELERTAEPEKLMSGVTDVSLGQFHSAAITADGSLYTWGMNMWGELGNGTVNEKSTDSDPIPKKIMDNVQAVSCGTATTLALTADGTVFAWGDNEHGTVGDGTTETTGTPKRIMDGVRAISCGGGASAAITNDNTLYMWGLNAFGVLANGEYGTDGDGMPVYSTSPVKVMDQVSDICLGGSYVIARMLDGSICTWGANNEGQLGDGTTHDVYTPTRISVP